MSFESCSKRKLAARQSNLQPSDRNRLIVGLPGTIKIQSRARGFLDRKKVRSRHRAATSIQKHARRRHAKKQVRMKRGEKEDEEWGGGRVEAEPPQTPSAPTTSDSKQSRKVRSEDFLRRSRRAKETRSGRRATVAVGSGKRRKPRPASAKVSGKAGRRRSAGATILKSQKAGRKLRELIGLLARASDGVNGIYISGQRQYSPAHLF